MYGQNSDNGFGGGGGPQAGWQQVSSSALDARVSFIRKTYAHLAGAILLFILLEAGLWMSGLAAPLASLMLSGGGMGWLVVLGLFIGVSWVADWWAHQSSSKGLQYLGLGLFTVAEAVIFVPLIGIAMATGIEQYPQLDPAVASMTFVGPAAILTAVVFAGLTVFVFATKKDFSFMRGLLVVVSLAALGLIIAGAIFGFTLGLWFSVAMVGLASGYILYQTSNVLHHYDTHQYVAAALALFSSVAMLFWYILRILLALRD